VANESQCQALKGGEIARLPKLCNELPDLSPGACYDEQGKAVSAQAPCDITRVDRADLDVSDGGSTSTGTYSL
jgi:hypothetical protein